MAAMNGPSIQPSAPVKTSTSRMNSPKGSVREYW